MSATAPRPVPLTRRRVLQAGGLAGLAGLVAGCAPRTVTEGRALGTDTGPVRVVNWTDYVDETDGDALGTVDRFGRATGIDVVYDAAYEGNDELLAGWFEPWARGAREVDADIVVPTNWLAERLRDAGRLERLPLELVPNHANLDPALLGLPWDRGARWHLPWQVGYTGLATLGTPARSLQELFDAGRVAIIPEWREAVGLVMLANGDDPGRATRDAAEVALDAIEALVAAGAVASYDFVDLLVAGQVDVAMAWSGDLAVARLDDPRLEFSIPVEGAVRWFDTMVIPRGAPSYAGAGAFMDFVYDPEQAARITAYVLYSSPVLGVQDALSDMGLDDLATNPLLFPDPVTAQRLVTWGGMARADEDAVEARFAAITA